MKIPYQLYSISKNKKEPNHKMHQINLQLHQILNNGLLILLKINFTFT